MMYKPTLRHRRIGIEILDEWMERYDLSMGDPKVVMLVPDSNGSPDWLVRKWANHRDVGHHVTPDYVFVWLVDDESERAVRVRRGWRAYRQYQKPRAAINQTISYRLVDDWPSDWSFEDYDALSGVWVPKQYVFTVCE